MGPPNERGLTGPDDRGERTIIGMRGWGIVVALIAMLVGLSGSGLGFTKTGQRSSAKPTLGSKLPPRLPASRGKTYYVDATSGNDANPGTLRRPWRSIVNAAERVPLTGSRIVVRAGTYEGEVIFNRRGNPKNPVTIKPFRGERVRLVGSTKDLPALWVNKARGLRVVGLEFSASLATSIRIENSSDIEIASNHIHGSGHHGILVVGTGRSGTTGNRNVQIWANRLHDNGGREGGYNLVGDHGIYLGAVSANDDGVDHRTVGAVIANNLFYDQPYGRHLQIGSQVANCIVTNNTFDRAYQPDPRAGSAIVFYGENNQFATSNAIVVNNIITNSARFGVTGTASQSLDGTTVVRNLLFRNAAGAFSPVMYRDGRRVVVFTASSDNITGRDPRYANASAKDYRPRSGSPAAGRALLEYAPRLDITGRLRDRDHPELGAFEKVSNR
jgi:hypothetical protein